jgi:hypothetical protein
MVDICRYGRYMIYVEFTIWLINSLPWKITIFNGKIIYKWTIYTMAMLNNQRVYVWCEMDSHGELWSRRLPKYFAHVFWKSTMRSTKQSTQQKPWDTLDTVDTRIHQNICYHLLSFAIHQNSQCPMFHCILCSLPKQRWHVTAWWSFVPMKALMGPKLGSLEVDPGETHRGDSGV